MNLSTGNWIAITGILIASLFALIGLLLKKGKSQRSNIKINQQQGSFSKGIQKIKLNSSQADENE
jgi:hypothetical protein